MRHILIVDDEQLIRYSLSAVLRDNETEIVVQADGRGALKAIREWLFDFCFLDIQLPDASGIDIVRMLRQLSPRTKVIMMTGSVVDEPSLRVIRENAFLFLNKPFDLFRVKRVLEKVDSVDENTYQEFEQLEERLSERRKARRFRAARPVTYTTVPPGKGKEDVRCADLLDISDAGTRIRTPEHLEPGSRVKFRNSVNEASGIVRWSGLDKQQEFYVAGIQFIGQEGG